MGSSAQAALGGDERDGGPGGANGNCGADGGEYGGGGEGTNEMVATTEGGGGGGGVVLQLGSTSEQASGQARTRRAIRSGVSMGG